MDVDLQGDGLLWLINRVVFHPRGFALGYNRETGEFSLLWNGTECGAFTADDDDECFAMAQALFARAQGTKVERCTRRLGWRWWLRIGINPMERHFVKPAPVEPWAWLITNPYDITPAFARYVLDKQATNVAKFVGWLPTTAELDGDARIWQDALDRARANLSAAMELTPGQRRTILEAKLKRLR